jgi:hypothetical protein
MRVKSSCREREKIYRISGALRQGGKQPCIRLAGAKKQVIGG